MKPRAILLSALILGLSVIPVWSQSPNSDEIRGFLRRNLPPEQVGQSPYRIGLLIDRRDLLRTVQRARMERSTYRFFSFFEEDFPPRNASKLRDFADQKGLTHLFILDRELDALALFDPKTGVILDRLFLERAAAEPPPELKFSESPGTQPGPRNERSRTVSLRPAVELGGSVQDFDLVRHRGVVIAGWVEDSNFHTARWSVDQLQAHRVHTLPQSLINISFVPGSNRASSSLGVLLVSKLSPHVSTTFYNYDLTSRTLQKNWTVSNVLIKRVGERIFGQSWNSFDFRFFGRTHPVRLRKGTWEFLRDSPMVSDRTFVTSFVPLDDPREIVRMTADGALEWMDGSTRHDRLESNFGDNPLSIPYFKTSERTHRDQEASSPDERERTQGIARFDGDSSGEAVRIAAVRNLRSYELQRNPSLLGRFFSGGDFVQGELVILELKDRKISPLLTSGRINGYASQVVSFEHEIWVLQVLPDQNRSRLLKRSQKALIP